MLNLLVRAYLNWAFLLLKALIRVQKGWILFRNLTIFRGKKLKKNWVPTESNSQKYDRENCLRPPRKILLFKTISRKRISEKDSFTNWNAGAKMNCLRITKILLILHLWFCGRNWLLLRFFWKTCEYGYQDHLFEIHTIGEKVEIFQISG